MSVQSPPAPTQFGAHTHPSSSPTGGAHDAAACLARALGAVLECRHEEAETELAVSAATFARAQRSSGASPEALVLALKDLFRRLDGQMPSLSHHDVDEYRAPVGEDTHQHWYPSVFTWCIEAYYTPE